MMAEGWVISAKPKPKLGWALPQWPPLWLLKTAASDAATGLSNYQFRAYLTGISFTTGLGVADDLQSLMVFTDPSTVGLAGQGVVTKLPLCEDM
jgi:hypothetical protein